MRWTGLLFLVGCDLLGTDKDTVTTDTADTGSVDTGDTDTLPFEARIHAFCLDTECTTIGLDGSASGDTVTAYEWTVRGKLAGTDADISVVLTEPGELVDVQLAVEDDGGTTSTAGVALAHLSFTLGREGSTGVDPGNASIAMPTGLPCGAPIGVASIGGCLRLNDALLFQASDLDSGGNATPRSGAVLYDARQGILDPVSKTGFADAAAWYQDTIHAGAVQFYNMSPQDYTVSGGMFPPIARDPVVLNAMGLSQLPESHFTFWMTPVSTGTDIFASHIDLSTGTPIFHEFKLTAACAENTWTFSMEPLQSGDVSFEQVIKPGG